MTVSRVPVPDLCCLWAESDTTPMNIALVGRLDAAGLVDARGEVDLERIRASIASHLDQAPMLRRVLRRTRFGQGRAVWVDDPGFSVDHHVVVTDPAPAFTGEQSFLEWCARETVRPLDRSRPLWRVTIVPGLPHGRLGFLVVVHHVVADGLRGVAMIAGLLDVDPEVTVPPGSWRPAPSPTTADLVLDNIRARVHAVRSIRPGRLGRRLSALRALQAEVISRAPATVLTGDIGSERQAVVVRHPLDDLRTAAHSLGCTINDLLLAAVTHGLREMLSCRGGPPEAMTLRATVPVGETNGHQGGMIAVSLPVGIDDIGERLRRIVADTSCRKQTPDGGIAGIVSMPAGLAHLGVLWARHTGATHINLYVTNVPGPSSALYLAGARLHDVAPLAPLVAGVRLSVTALSYDDTFAVALLGDRALTDFAALAAGVRNGFDAYLTAGKAIRDAP